MSSINMIKVIIECVIMVTFVLGKVSDASIHRQLRAKLMKNYSDVFIRPVKDVSSSMNVTIRPIFRNLIEMDIKNQKFTMDSWMKLVWIDEFLTWDPKEFNGTDKIHFPAKSVWLPDVTFYENVDVLFQRFKTDTVVLVDSSGKVTWFVPTILVSGCPIRVTWYPFDIQVCDMTFGSFVYSGDELQLYPSTGADSVQSRYLENGVWDMVAVGSKQLVTKFACCENPFYEVQYRLIFKRRPDFYLKYLIFPEFLLSILSTLVFYLPPESGEKITLSITNLLALVVFQRLISENMPPSGAESPIIGSFFLSMIGMVGISVAATIVVLHINQISYRPVPSWLRWIVIEKLPSFVCIGGVRKRHRRMEKFMQSEKIFEKYITSVASIAYPSYTESNDCTESDTDPTRTSNSSAKNFEELMQDEEQNKHEWKLVSLVIDRYLMIIFATVTLFITIILLTVVQVGSTAEFEEELDILNNSWKMDTHRYL